MSNIHILGIGGTFMAGLAVIAKAAGHQVSGQDGPLYPPMSEVLANTEIEVLTTDQPNARLESADEVIIGNALSRGHPSVEALLNRGQAYTSGPAWLAEHVLRERWVIAVAGTHGKTTTASLIAWLLEAAGFDPGFLIGGQPGNFASAARLGSAPFFVIEADEYDTAFFDKRAKFVHFHPNTLVLNNLEYDHADIYPDLAAIEREFHHLVRTVPGTGSIIVNADEPALERVLHAGCWSRRIGFGQNAPGDGHVQASDHGWQLGAQPYTPPLPGAHNAMNTAAALLAARDAGVALPTSIAALRDFAGVRRRLEWVGEAHGISVLDDFAHHPSAIRATLSALAETPAPGRLLAVFEPRSNSLQMGVHSDTLASAFSAADHAFVLVDPALSWDIKAALAPLGASLTTAADVDALITAISAEARSGDRVVVMSNGAFDGIHQRLLTALERHGAQP